MNKVAIETEQVIIGTAGHIDHGKTALVKALTGIDADTLPEEKRRGITIELGFVFMDTPGFDKQVVFIDVPGHEKLVRTMVAGASNIDAALLVIAADDGVSAQTMEHLDILQLLGIKSGIVALTKTDLVDGGCLRPVSGEIRNFVQGTFLSDAEIIPVSSVTGSGVNEIKDALLRIARNVKKRRDSGIFRMPVDRVFTMEGFGTVIAGTILSGEVSVGDTIEIFPDGITAKVRGVQIHRENTRTSCIGKRTAINLQDVKKEKLRRGQCAGAPGSLAVTNRLHTRLHLLGTSNEGLKNRTTLRLHIGTDEVICRSVLLDCQDVGPGQSALVQFLLQSPTVALPGDRFVIRTFSPLRTIGGGVILDAGPAHHKRFDARTIEGLRKLEGSLADAVEQMFAKSGFSPKTPGEIAVSIGEKEDDIKKIVGDLHNAGELVSIGAERYIHAKSYQELAARTVVTIKDYLGRNPYRLLMPLADLQSHLLRLSDRLTFEAVVEDLCRKKIIYKKDTRIGIVGHKIGLKRAEQEIADRIEKSFREAGFATPLDEDINKEMGISPDAFKNIMNSLMEQECLIRLSDKVIYHVEYVQTASKVVTDHIKEHGGITVAQLRDKLGVSRKYGLALLEYFDAKGVTKRVGDSHVMR
jgi:selenocysteine-specific elongation factor